MRLASRQTKGELLSIKFEGNTLAARSLPIYELACSLIAVQRIVHKAALFSEGRLEKNVHLPTWRREELALRIKAHRHGSDIWGLAPYLTNPAVGPIFQQLIAMSLGALAPYVLKTFMRTTRAPQNQILVVNIFPEIKQLADRVLKTLEVLSALKSGAIATAQWIP